MSTDPIGTNDPLNITKPFDILDILTRPVTVPAQENITPQTSGVTNGDHIFAASLLRQRTESRLPSLSPLPSLPPSPTLNDYRNQALSLIGGTGGDVRQRNARISGAYADLYLRNPEAFRWPGAAAYASGQVGFAMDGARIGSMIANLPTDIAEKMLYKVLNEVPKEILKAVFPEVPDQVWDVLQSSVPEFVKQAAVKTILATLPGVGVNYVLGKIVGYVVEQNAGALTQMLANGNIEIFKNIYPACLAYQNGGIAEMRRLETTLSPAEVRRFQPIRLAFEDIDRGINLVKSGQQAAGERLIQQGNRKLIDFEQRVVAQPIAFDPHPTLTYLISPLAFGNLASDPTNFSDPSTLDYFWSHHSPNSIGDANQRVDWIANEIFPHWYTQRAQQPGLVNSNMNEIITRGRQAGGHY
jgi:hypothetical protein